MGIVEENDTWSLNKQGSLFYYQPPNNAFLFEREKIPGKITHRICIKFDSPSNGFLFDDPCKNRWNFIETLVQIWYSHNCLSSQQVSATIFWTGHQGKQVTAPGCTLYGCWKKFWCDYWGLKKKGLFNTVIQFTNGASIKCEESEEAFQPTHSD